MAVRGVPAGFGPHPGPRVPHRRWRCGTPPLTRGADSYPGLWKELREPGKHFVGYVDSDAEPGTHELLFPARTRFAEHHRVRPHARHCGWIMKLFLRDVEALRDFRDELHLMSVLLLCGRNCWVERRRYERHAPAPLREVIFNSRCLSTLLSSWSRHSGCSAGKVERNGCTSSSSARAACSSPGAMSMGSLGQSGG
jgi:hypothetical protein